MKTGMKSYWAFAIAILLGIATAGVTLYGCGSSSSSSNDYPTMSVQCGTSSCVK